MAMGADYSLELISIETYAPQFIGHNKLFLGGVSSLIWSIKTDYQTLLSQNNYVKDSSSGMIIIVEKKIWFEAN